MPAHNSSRNDAMRKALIACLVLTVAATVAGTCAASPVYLKDFPRCGESITATSPKCRLNPRWGAPGKWDLHNSAQSAVNTGHKQSVFARAALPRGVGRLSNAAYAVQFKARAGGVAAQPSLPFAAVKVRMWLVDASGREAWDVENFPLDINAGGWTFLATSSRPAGGPGFEPAFIYVSLTPSDGFDFDGTVEPGDPLLGLKELEIGLYPGG
jgi:hypothetical protein